MPRRPTIASSRSSCWKASRPACRGSRSCASARTSAAPSTASTPQDRALRREGYRAAHGRRRHRPQPRSRSKPPSTTPRPICALSERTSLAAFLWGFLGKDGPRAEPRALMRDIPAETRTVEAHLEGAQGRGFRFVGPTTIYAFMQSSGMVNDHLVAARATASAPSCSALSSRQRAHEQSTHDRSATSRPPARAPGSACCPAAASTCSIPRPPTSRSRTSPTASPGSRAGTARRVGPHAFSVAQHVLRRRGHRVCAQSAIGQLRWRLAALLHDAPEYVIGDLISPFKTAIGLDYKAFELRLLDAIHRRFTVLPADLPTRSSRRDQARRPHCCLLRGDPLGRVRLDGGARFFRRPDGLERRDSHGKLAALDLDDRRAAQRDFSNAFNR